MWTNLKGADTSPPFRGYRNFRKVLPSQAGKESDLQILFRMEFFPFEHTGVWRIQDPRTFAIKLPQDSYFTQLRPTLDPLLSTCGDEVCTTPRFIECVRSLSCGIAWVSQCRRDGIVYVGCFQRIAKQPTMKRDTDLDLLFRWLKRVACISS